MSSYKQVSIDVPAAKARKLSHGLVVNITARELQGNDEKLFLHPANYEKIMKAKRANKGVRLQMSRAEIEYDAMHGGNIFKSIWKGLKTLWGPVIKPALSVVADNLVPVISGYTGQPALTATARQGLKQLTGVGVKPKMVKGSPEAKAYMAALRQRRKHGKGIRVDM